MSTKRMFDAKFGEGVEPERILRPGWKAGKKFMVARNFFQYRGKKKRGRPRRALNGRELPRQKTEKRRNFCRERERDQKGKKQVNRC